MLELTIRKLNYKKIADYYGEGATYDAIEGRFRIIRKDAEKLKAELDNGEREPAPNRGTKSANSTPRKPRPSKDGSSSASLHCMFALLAEHACALVNADAPTQRRPQAA